MCCSIMACNFFPSDGCTFKSKKDVKLQLQVRLKNIILISLFVHLFKDTWFYVKYVD